MNSNQVFPRRRKVDNILLLVFLRLLPIQEIIAIKSLPLKVSNKVAINAINKHFASLKRDKLFPLINIDKSLRSPKIANVFAFLCEHVRDFKLIVLHLHHQFLVKLLDELYFGHLRLVGAV